MGNTSRQWVHQWWTRYQEANQDPTALETRSSRPHTIHRPRDQHEDAILEAKDRYPMHGPKKLRELADIPLSPVTIWKVLREHGRVHESPARQGRRVYNRFERDDPNDLWQVDIMDHRLEGGTGPKVWLVTILDDHSRRALVSRVLTEQPHEADMVRLLRWAMRLWGRPKQVLSDCGHQFYSQDHVPKILTQWLDALGVNHIHASPGSPETLGKQERWHKSIQEEWIDWRPSVGDASAFQAQVNAWLDHYNRVRPHEALGMGTPLEAYVDGLKPVGEGDKHVNEAR
jgi:transposase InsO family protein